MTWVTVDGRRFVVEFFDDGSPRRIKERKKINPGHPYLEHVIDRPYWHAEHHKIGGTTTMVSRILELAKRKDLTK